jgi:hypothetical protein
VLTQSPLFGSLSRSSSRVVSARALSIQSLSLFSSSSLRRVHSRPHTRRPQVQPYAVQRPLRDRPSPHLQQVPRRLQRSTLHASARQLLPTATPGAYSFFFFFLFFFLSLPSCPHPPALVLQGAVQYTNLGHHTLHLVLAASFYNQPLLSCSHSHSYSSALPHFLEIVFAFFFSFSFSFSFFFLSQSQLIDICVSSI